MRLIGAIKNGGQTYICEADYHFFILNLRDRIEAADDFRPALDVVDSDIANKYVDFMRRFQLDQADIERDYFSLSTADREQSISSFLPSVFIDFDEKAFYSSHPDSHYLNFGAYLPPGWMYKVVDNVLSRIKPEHAYWKEWNIA